MINIIYKENLKSIIVATVLLVLFFLPLIDMDTLFLFKKTQATTGIMKYMDLVENKIGVEYEVDETKYFEEIEGGAFHFEKDGEIELIYDVNHPEKIIEQSVKTTKWFCLGVVALCLLSIINLKSDIDGEKIYNDKKAKVVEGKIFEVVNNGVMYRVCMKVEGEEQVFYLDTDLNLEPVLESLKIEALPIYLIGKHAYRVDTRPIEEKIEIIKERFIFLNKNK